MHIDFENVVRRITAEYGLGLLDNPVQCRDALMEVLQYPDRYPGLWLGVTPEEYKAETGLFMRMIEAGFHQRLMRSSDPEHTAALLGQMLAADYAVSPEVAESAVSFLSLLLGKAEPVFTVCLECGKSLRISWKVCPYCGTKVIKNDMPPPPVIDTQTPPPEGFVRIPGGTFLMGSPPQENGRGLDEELHRVTLSSFCMSKYAVTQEEYQAVMGTDPSRFKGFNLPVDSVSWHDAIEFCNRRSTRDKLHPAYTRHSDAVAWDRRVNGYRLPTEAEWEYACRAATASPYYTGNTVDKAGWYAQNSGGMTHPVGLKEPNPWGLYDMHGNVWEWCWDWYGPYGLHPQTDPIGPALGDCRTARGGSWYYGGRNVRSAVRYGKRFVLANQGNSMGFRLVSP